MSAITVATILMDLEAVGTDPKVLSALNTNGFLKSWTKLQKLATKSVQTIAGVLKVKQAEVANFATLIENAIKRKNERYIVPRTSEVSLSDAFAYTLPVPAGPDNYQGMFGKHLFFSALIIFLDQYASILRCAIPILWNKKFPNDLWADDSDRYRLTMDRLMNGPDRHFTNDIIGSVHREATIHAEIDVKGDQTFFFFPCSDSDAKLFHFDKDSLLTIGSRIQIDDKFYWIRHVQRRRIDRSDCVVAFTIVGSAPPPIDLLRGYQFLARSREFNDIVKVNWSAESLAQCFKSQSIDDMDVPLLSSILSRPPHSLIDVQIDGIFAESDTESIVQINPGVRAILDAMGVRELVAEHVTSTEIPYSKFYHIIQIMQSAVRQLDDSCPTASTCSQLVIPTDPPTSPPSLTAFMNWSVLGILQIDNRLSADQKDLIVACCQREKVRFFKK